MAPEFWLIYESEFYNPGKYINIISADSYGWSAGCWVFETQTRASANREIGRFFLAYAYSTPAGVAYRLAYGVSKP